MNDALLCKWLWRFSTELDALWRRKVAEKYGVDANHWDPKPPRTPYGVGLWSGICNRLHIFKKGMKYKIGSGNRTRFWTDYLIGDKPLADSFPLLYNVTRKQMAFVADCYQQGTTGSIVWNLDLSRRLTDAELGEATALTALLDTTTTNNEEDSRIWWGEKSGEFSVSSCYKTCHNSISSWDFNEKDVWDALVPSKVVFFIWLIHHNSILTQDIMARRGIITINRCIMCKKSCESINHLLLHCPMAREIWNYFISEFGLYWNFNSDITHIFQERSLDSFTPKSELLWRILSYAMCWIL